MLEATAAEPPTAQGQRTYGATGESAAKYAKYTDGTRQLQDADETRVTKPDQPRVLEDITNVATAPRQAAGAAWFSMQGSKGTPSPLCDEAESTGLGCPRDVTFSDEEEEEDPFMHSDVDDFPIVGTGTSLRPGAATPGDDEDLRELENLLGPDKADGSGPPTREVAESLRLFEEPGAAAAAAANPPTWRSPEDRGGPNPGAAGADEPPGWNLSSQRDDAASPAASASAQSGPAQRLLAALQLGGREDELDGDNLVGAGVDFDDDDPQDVSEYSADIRDRLALDEVSPQMPKPDYMEAQPELTAHMRAVAVDWLVEVQVKFQLRTETLFLAVSLFDRFLSTKRVRRKDLQLTVVSATFIAAKFEEIDPPDVRDFVFITKQACLKEAILSMEVAMLTTLEFCLCRPTVAHFLERYQRANRCSEAHRHLFQYILELAMMDLTMTRYSPSHQAAAALLVSCGLLQRRPAWPAELARHSEAAERSIRRCAREMCRMLEVAPTSQLQAVRRKFLRQEYSAVAALDF